MENTSTPEKKLNFWLKNNCGILSSIFVFGSAQTGAVGFVAVSQDFPNRESPAYCLAPTAVDLNCTVKVSLIQRQLPS
jgi:hypothetical protein